MYNPTSLRFVGPFRLVRFKLRKTRLNQLTAPNLRAVALNGSLPAFFVNRQNRGCYANNRRMASPAGIEPASEV